MSDSSNALAKMIELRNKVEGSLALYDALEESIALEDIWPEAFDGDCTVSSGFVTDHKAGKTVLRFTRDDDDGEHRDIPIEQVPEVILIGHAKDRGIKGHDSERDPKSIHLLPANPENVYLWEAMRRERGRPSDG